jgi:K+-transporting ATPase A subunit
VGYQQGIVEHIKCRGPENKFFIIAQRNWISDQAIAKTSLAQMSGIRRFAQNGGGLLETNKSHKVVCILFFDKMFYKINFL